MAKIIETAMYVCVDPVSNQNRFWKYERLDGVVSEPGKKGVMETGDTRITWGRVGDSGESQLKIWADGKFVASKLKEKTRATKDRQAYTKVNVVSTEVSSPPSGGYGLSVTSSHVAKLAMDEIAGGCAITAALVKKLAETNKHELVAATGGVAKGGMDIDLETGMVRTALGVVTLDTVKEARIVLDKMLPFVTKHDTENSRYTDTLGAYLRLVPQFVGYKKGWHTDFINIGAQNSLLDQLETSVELAEQRLADALKAPGQPVVKTPSMFECKLALVEDKEVTRRINALYYDSVNQRHSSSNLKPVKIWKVVIPHMAAAFETDGRKVGNIQQLWHGTRVFNILSILKRGYVLPGALTSAQICGAMFGNGLYFSNQSTKSLNYSRGGVWSSGVDNVCYMFSNDVAMGREYIPSGSCNGIPSHSRGQYDSCHAIPGRSGIMNDEQIVYRSGQVNPRYLIEFS
jgi:poly [ADP-ribose] polymerase